MSVINGTMKCDICGRFKKEKDIIAISGEHDDIWHECINCLSKVDLEHYFPDRTLLEAP